MEGGEEKWEEAKRERKMTNKREDGAERKMKRKTEN